MAGALKQLAIGSALTAGAALTFAGFTQTSWFSASVFGSGNLIHYVLFLLIGALTITLIARWGKLNIIASGGSVAFATAILAGAVWPLVVTILFSMSCYAMGRFFTQLLKIEKVTSITAFLIGACLYGTIVSIAAHYPVNYPGLYGLALAVPVFFGWRSIHAAARVLRNYLIFPSETKLLDLVIVLVALVHFSVSLMPEVGHDALAMHLFIPGHLAQRHEWGFDVTTYVWAVMPMLGDWLFSIGYMLAGEQAARLINVGFIFILSWLVRDLVIWAGGNAIGGRWAVLLFLTTPLTFTESSSLFIESIWASFVVASSLAVFKLMQSDDEKTSHLRIAGILLGGAVATKAVTFTILPAILCVLIWCYRSWMKRQSIRALIDSLFLFILIGVIPYARAWYLTGNPVFPFFNQIFQSSLWPAVAFDPPAVFAKGVTWDILYQVTFHSERFLESSVGAAGFQWLLLFSPALLTLLVSRHRRGLVLFAVAVLSVTLTFQSLAYLRYVFPSFAWVAAGIGVAISGRGTGSVVCRRFFFFTGWAVVLLNLVFFKSGTYYGDFSSKALMGKSERVDYLNKRLPIRNAVELVNSINIGRTPVAVFSSPLTAGLNSDGLYPNWYNHHFGDKVSNAKTVRDMAQILMEEGVDYIILDSNWGTPNKRILIENVTQELATFSNITVSKLDNKYHFQTELLENTDFKAFDGWSFLTDTSTQITGQVLVTVTAPASQSVSILPGIRYQNSVTAKCADQPTQGRLQVNWLDSQGSFISTDINVFDCTTAETIRSMVVTAPTNATTAVVYATAHSNTPIIISKVSFKL